MSTTVPKMEAADAANGAKSSTIATKYTEGPVSAPAAGGVCSFLFLLEALPAPSCLPGGDEAVGEEEEEEDAWRPVRMTRRASSIRSKSERILATVRWKSLEAVVGNATRVSAGSVSASGIHIAAVATNPSKLLRAAVASSNIGSFGARGVGAAVGEAGAALCFVTIPEEAPPLRLCDDEAARCCEVAATAPSSSASLGILMAAVPTPIPTATRPSPCW